MKLLLALLLVSGSAFSYTSSPAGNVRIKDPSWNDGEKRDPASLQTKSTKHEKESEKNSPAPKQ